MTKELCEGCEQEFNDDELGTYNPNDDPEKGIYQDDYLVLCRECRRNITQETGLKSEVSEQ